MTFSIAVIGCGWISQSRHGPAYARYASEHPDVALSACCDIDPQRAATFAAQYGFQRCYTDYQAMLAADRPSVVCLNVPVDRICEIGCQVMQRGFSLLSEKPPGLTLIEINRLIAAARDTSVLHQVAFNRRFAPLVTELKERLTGREIRHIDMHFFRIGRVHEDFSTTAIHAIDTVRFLAGCDYSQVRFSYQNLLENDPFQAANFFLDCQFTSGASASISLCPATGLNVERSLVHTEDSVFSLSMNLGPDAPGKLQQFRSGQLVLDLDGLQCVGTVAGSAAVPGPVSDHDFILSGFLAEDSAFFDAVRAGRQPEHDFASCRQSVEIMQALRERHIIYAEQR